MKHNAHVVEWLWWEFKKDKVWYWFPQVNPQPVIDLNCPS